MNSSVTIRTVSLILILTMLFSLSGCTISSSNEKENIAPEETVSVDISDHSISDKIADDAQSENSVKPGYIPKNVPLYDQNKYTRIPFGVCSVATDGCGITCAAMVISYLTEFTIMPDYMGRHYDLRSKTNEQRMIKALNDFNIEVVKRYYGKKDWKKVYQALEDGYLVISLQGTGLFTTKEHFILLTGLTKDGKVTVNDPNGKNYKVYAYDELKDGFKHGFEPNLIYRNGGRYYVLEYTGCFIPFGIKPSPVSHTTISPE